MKFTDLIGSKVTVALRDSKTPVTGRVADVRENLYALLLQTGKSEFKLIPFDNISSATVTVASTEGGSEKTTETTSARAGKKKVSKKKKKTSTRKPDPEPEEEPEEEFSDDDFDVDLDDEEEGEGESEESEDDADDFNLEGDEDWD